MSTQRRDHTGSAVAGVILIGLGLFFLMVRTFDFLFGQLPWPWLIVGVGGLLFVGMLLGGRTAAGLAIPASIVTAVGAILLYQSVTGHWESWAYAWALILTSVGAGVFLTGVWSGNPEPRRSGWNLAKVGLMLFILFGAFFELVVFGFGRQDLRQVAFPALLIVLGLYLVVRRLGPGAARASSASPPASPGPSTDTPRP
jgi:hypothetical protein